MSGKILLKKYVEKKLYEHEHEKIYKASVILNKTKHNSEEFL